MPMNAWKKTKLRATGRISSAVVPMFLRAFIEESPHWSKKSLSARSLKSSKERIELRIFSV